MTTGPDFTININHQDIRQGASALGVVEQLLRSIDQRLGLMSTSSVRVNQTLNITRNTIVQNHAAITQVNNDLSRTTNVLNQVERGTRRWGTSLRSVNLTVGRLLTNFSRLSARSGALAASGFGAVQRRGNQSFAGLFNGGGIPGLVGDTVRAPFAVAEFGLRIGGDLAQGVLGGLGRALGGVGGALGKGAGLGILAGGPAGLIGGALAGGGSILASTAGGAAGIGGAILGALGQSAGAILGAAGELGGRIAESLTRGASRGLLIGAGVSLFSITQAAEFQQLEKGFGALLKGTEDQTAALKQLEEAADGTISKLGLLKSANLALSLGVAETSKEIATMIEASKLLGRRLGLSPDKAFDRLTVGLARGSLRVIDDIGVNPNRERAYRDYAASVGVLVTELSSLEEAQAFNEETMRLIQELVERGKTSTDGLADSTRNLADLIDSLKASASDLSVEWGLALAPAAYEVGDALKELLQDGREWLELHQSDIAQTTVSFLRGIPGFFRDAAAAARGLTADVAKFLGFSDDTISAGGAALSGKKKGSPFDVAARAALQSSGALGLFGGGSAAVGLEALNQESDSFGGRLSIFGRSFVKDLPTVVAKLKQGIGDALTSDFVTENARRLGALIGEGFLDATVRPGPDPKRSNRSGEPRAPTPLEFLKDVLTARGARELAFGTTSGDLSLPWDDGVEQRQTFLITGPDGREYAVTKQQLERLQSASFSANSRAVQAAGGVISTAPTRAGASTASPASASFFELASLAPLLGIIPTGLDLVKGLAPSYAAAQGALGLSSFGNLFGAAAGSGFANINLLGPQRRASLPTVSPSDVLASIQSQGFNTGDPELVSHILRKALGAEGITNVDGSVRGGRVDRLVKRQAGDFLDALKDSERGLREELREREDFLRGLDRVHKRQQDAIEDLIEEMGKVTDAHFEQAVAIRERSAAEREEVRRRANESLQVLPNEVANRFAGELDQPGIALHARHAFARETRLRRRERARDINQAFGSRGFEDAFGNRGFGGFGTGTPAVDEIFGGLSGSLTATEATEQLLEAVKASAEFAEEAAKIRNAALEETAKISREEAEARAELDAGMLKSIAELTAALAGRQVNEKTMLEAITAQRKEIEQIKAEQSRLNQQIRSVK